MLTERLSALGLPHISHEPALQATRTVKQQMLTALHRCFMAAVEEETVPAMYGGFILPLIIGRLEALLMFSEAEAARQDALPFGAAKLKALFCGGDAVMPFAEAVARLYRPSAECYERLDDLHYDHGHDEDCDCRDCDYYRTAHMAALLLKELTEA